MFPDTRYYTECLEKDALLLECFKKSKLSEMDENKYLQKNSIRCLKGSIGFLQVCGYHNDKPLSNKSTFDGHICRHSCHLLIISTSQLCTLHIIWVTGIQVEPLFLQISLTVKVEPPDGHTDDIPDMMGTLLQLCPELLLNLSLACTALCLQNCRVHYPQFLVSMGVWGWTPPPRD